jgi:hypothetical protein
MLGSERNLSPEVARFFLGLSFTENDYERIKSLSEKANEGELTPQEHEMLSTYVLLGDLLTIVQSVCCGTFLLPLPCTQGRGLG